MLHPRARPCCYYRSPPWQLGLRPVLFYCGDENRLGITEFALATTAGTLGIAQDSPLWIIGVLTLTGLQWGWLSVSARVMPDQTPPGTADRRTSSALCATRTYRSIILGLAGGVSLGPEHPIMTVKSPLRLPLALVCYRASTEWSDYFSLCRNHRRAVWHTCCGGLIFSQTLNGSSEVPLWDRLLRR